MTRSKVNQRSLSSLMNSGLTMLSDKESNSIIGGDPTPAQIAALQALLFSPNGLFTQQSDCGAQIWTDFQAQVNALITTNVGYDLINQLVTSSNGNHIKISGQHSSLSGADGGQYVDSTNTLLLGDLDYSLAPTAWNYFSQVASHFGTISHELFHALADFTGASTPAYEQSVSRELDAYLFSTLAEAELDEKSGTTNLLNSYMYNDRRFFTANAANPTQAYTFQTALFDMFHSNQFTVENYNLLAQNFLAGSYSGGIYTGTSAPITETQFTGSQIGHFINDYQHSSYYSTTLPPFPTNPPVNPNANTGGSGGGVGGPSDGGTAGTGWLEGGWGSPYNVVFGNGGYGNGGYGTSSSPGTGGGPLGNPTMGTPWDAAGYNGTGTGNGTGWNPIQGGYPSIPWTTP